jgi:lipopolysaccharide export system permease protein
MAGNMIKLADLVVNKGVDLLSVGKLFFYMLPWLFTFTVPISVLTATLLTFGRLSSDNEIIAMRASGISLYKLVFPLIMLGLVISLISYELNDWILPRLRFEQEKLIGPDRRQEPPAYLEAGTYYKGIQGLYSLHIRHRQEQAHQHTHLPAPGRPPDTHHNRAERRDRIYQGARRRPS